MHKTRFILTQNNVNVNVNVNLHFYSALVACESEVLR